MVAQEDRPLAVVGNIRGLFQNIDDGMTVFLSDGHVHARHQREVVGHVALVAVAEVVAHVFRPLIGLGQEQAAAVMPIHHRPHLLDHRMGFRQVFVVGALAHAQVGNGVQPHPVHAQVQPEPHDLGHGFHHRRIVVVQIRLVREEAVPVILLRHRVPGPIGGFGVGEDDAGFRKFLVVVIPDVEIPLRRTARRAARGLKPGMLVGGMVDHQFGDDLQTPRVRLADEGTEVGQGAVLGMNVLVIGNIVAVVPHRRRIERQQPQGVHAQILEIIQALNQAAEIADPIVVTVAKRLDV